MADLPMPVPGEHDLQIKVLACGVCRTDLHILDGDLPSRRAGLVPGHEVVGRVVANGRLATRFQLGDRVGVPWLGGTCGHCPYCAGQRENLCDTPVFTGYDRNGGFAQHAVADARYCFALPERYDDMHAAPLQLGACWAGTSDTQSAQELDAALIFAPVGSLVPAALRATRKGGVVVCAGIHMSDIPSFEYALLWGARSVRSVANLTREDGDAFFSLIAHHPVTTHVQPFALAQANEAIAALRSGAVDGAAVLLP
jgi:propanol-preferring alcohol dehydrogenase